MQYVIRSALITIKVLSIFNDTIKFNQLLLVIDVQIVLLTNALLFNSWRVKY